MPQRLAAALFCTLTILMAHGCGTISNLKSREPQVYGGLACDPLLQCNPLASNSSMDLSGVHGEGKEGAIVAAAVLLFIPTIFVADISTNLVLDTVTLPLAYYLNKKARIGEHDPDPNPDPGPQEPRPLFVPGCLRENRETPSLVVAPRSIDSPTSPGLPMPSVFAPSSGSLPLPAAVPQHSAQWLFPVSPPEITPPND